MAHSGDFIFCSSQVVPPVGYDSLIWLLLIGEKSCFPPWLMYHIKKIPLCKTIFYLVLDNSAVANQQSDNLIPAEHDPWRASACLPPNAWWLPWFSGHLWVFDLHSSPRWARAHVTRADIWEAGKDSRRTLARQTREELSLVSSGQVQSSVSKFLPSDTSLPPRSPYTILIPSHLLGYLSAVWLVA